MLNYIKYLFKNPMKLVYCITALLFCTACFLIILTQLTDFWEMLLVGILIFLIFLVAQAQPVIEYIDKQQ